MIKLGIDAIGFYTSHYYLELAELAKARNIDPDKFHVGLGQFKMAIPAPDDDIVSMAAMAAKQALDYVDREEITHILFATESSFDHSKCAGTYLQRLLDLPSNCRVVELKQACYGGTAALQFGMALLARNPREKILVIASDVARYALNSSGESSQGCGAVALVLSAKPRILAIEEASGLHTEEVMDFWRPSYLDVPMVEGKYSALIYLRALENCWKDFQNKTALDYRDIDLFCYHTPVPKLVEKAHKHLLKINDIKKSNEEIEADLELALRYPKIVGNTYTAALYISLLSLLHNASTPLKGKRIGFYSYGSGCMAEFFTGIVQNDYLSVLNSAECWKMLENRKVLTFSEYEEFYQFKLPEDGSAVDVPLYSKADFRLKGMKDHQRQYENRAAQKIISIKERSKKTEQKESSIIETRSPGKIILSGEHSVVYGCPAMAFAVNRYAHVCISPDISKMISFDLLSSRYKDSVTIKTLLEVKNRIVQKYEAFLSGNCGIRDVLQTPFELTQFVLINFSDRLNSKILNGLNISTDTTIPVGCGMGSSAALILSVILATSRFFKIPLNEERILKLAFEAESLQHGKASQLDLHTSMLGGCVKFDDGKYTSCTAPSFPLFVVNTGTPMNSTGECVQHVSSIVRDYQWEDFSAVTQSISNAINKGVFDDFQKGIRENHRLLTGIGVVPDRVQTFISDVEAVGAAAKICGAGAITGDAAGIVLIIAESDKEIAPICSRYGYELMPIQIEHQGLHVA